MRRKLKINKASKISELEIEERELNIAIKKEELAELKKPFYRKPNWILAYLSVLGLFISFLFTQKTDALRNEKLLGELKEKKLQQEKDSFYATITFQNKWQDSALKYQQDNQNLLALLEEFTIKIPLSSIRGLQCQAVHY